MYRCDNCNKIIGKYLSPIRKVIATRKKVYTYTTDKGKTFNTHGWEIEKEVQICKACAKGDD